uniref:phenylalanine--tRNA ligase n=1 Tax=Renouxia sp. TaxID=2485823 RepID=A0A3G3MH66_9FLOR|nr:phenylalanyl-tRNA synthetase beta chain [Renouxia sp.]
MKISWNWLKEKTHLSNISYVELSEKLTLAGFEVESIKYNKEINDTIIELSITSNRSDINSLMSLTTEIGAIIKTWRKADEIIPLQAIEHRTIDLSLQGNLDICEQLKVSIIHNVNITQSPKWLHNYLVAYDIKPLNNPLDIINLINLEWGQSIQILTSSQLNNLSNIHLKLEKDTQNQFTYPTLYLNEEKLYSLRRNLEIPFLYMDNSIISIIIVGIIYKQDYLNKTRNRTAKETSTPSKIQFINAYNQTLNLICRLYSTEVDTTYIYNDTKNTYVRPIIKIDINKINQVLGPLESNSNSFNTYLNEDIVIDILRKLRFNTFKKNAILEIQAPENRSHDIAREIDIIEEIGRIYGFNYFKDELPKANQKGQISFKTLTINKIRHILRSMGLHEVIHYSLNFTQDCKSRAISLYNPLTIEQSQLRTSLIDNLIQAKLYNVKQGNDILECFEIGRIFLYDSDKQIKREKVHLSGLLGHPHYNRSNWSDKPSQLSWLQAKGHLEEFFERMHIQVSWEELPIDSDSTLFNSSYLHPKRTSYIIHDKKTLGLFSQLKNKVTKKIHINHLIYIFEIDIDNLLNAIRTPKHLSYINQPYSNYPRITRDISIRINKYMPIQKILHIMQNIQKTTNYQLESVILFDEYYTTNKKSETKNIGLRVTYRSSHKTLTNTEIEQVEKSLKADLEKQLMIQIYSESKS